MRIVDIRTRHVRSARTPEQCKECLLAWPCIPVQLLVALDEANARVLYWRERYESVSLKEVQP